MSISTAPPEDKAAEGAADSEGAAYSAASAPPASLKKKPTRGSLPSSRLGSGKAALASAAKDLRS